MKALDKAILYSFLILLTSCGVREPNYCKMADRITGDYVKEFANPKGLYLSSTGGAMMHDIQEIFVGFSSYNTLTVDQARILYVDLMEEFLCRINSNEEIRPYLHNYPFEEENIKLMVSFSGVARETSTGRYVALMSIAKNHTLYFAAYNPKTEKLYDLHEENYQEALKKVKGIQYENNMEN